MKQQLRLKNLKAAARGGLEALVASLADEHLGRRLRPEELEAAALVAILEKVPARQLFKATLRLELSGRIFFCRDEGDDIESAADNAFVELESRVRRHSTRQRRKDLEPQQQPGQRLPRLKQRLPQGRQAGRAGFFDQLERRLASLANFVQRELLYLRSSGELASDYPTVDDVVDEVLVRALDSSRSNAESAISESALLQLSISVLAERVAEVRTELLQGLAVEDSEEIDPAEALYFYEQLTESDAGRFDSLIFAPAASDPAEAADFEQIRRHLLEALRLLPVSWRRIVMLSQMDDLPAAAVAASLGIDEHTVRTCLDHADAFLRDRLQQAAVQLPDNTAPADYLVIETPFSSAVLEIQRELSDLLSASSRSKRGPAPSGRG